MFKKIIAYKLKIAVKIYLWRAKPEVIAITGSAGKTSTKELATALLSTEFDVLGTSEGYNTELGAPLSLFGEKSPDEVRSIISWAKILIRCYVKALFSRNHTEKLVVEMGADTSGDIRYLANLFKPSKGVILTVLPVHLSSFENIEAVAREKGELAQNIVRGGKVFLNIDDSRVSEMKPGKDVQVVTFGAKAGADFRAKNIKSDLSGLSFELIERGVGHKIKVRLYGDQMIYPLLAAIAVARMDHISYKRIEVALKDVQPYKGRMNVIEGAKGSIIIDDSYNANPESMLRALDFLGKQKGRKIALLGNMNELGGFEREGHEQVGESAAKNADILVTVGALAEKYLAGAAQNSGLAKENIKSFEDAQDAGKYIAKILKEKDVVLAKGSQNKVRLELAIEYFMAHPNEKEKVLVRQSRFWRNQA